MKKLLLTTIILSSISTISCPLFAGIYEDKALQNQQEMLRIMQQQEHREKMDRLMRGQIF